MSIDKIKIELGDHVFNYWCSLVNDKLISYSKKLELLNIAKKKLEILILNNTGLESDSRLTFKELDRYKTELIFINYLLNGWQ